MDMTACFLPKPVTGVNGNGMHTNLSLSRKGEEPLLRQEGRGRPVGSSAGTSSSRILANANDLCLMLNSSVNSYRRLDPHFEAPNQIKASAIDRGSMVRIPLGNERSARVEVRSIAPDANPYLAIYPLLRTGLEGPHRRGGRRQARRAPASCPTTSTTPSGCSRRASSLQELLGEEVHAKFAELKLASGRALPQGARHRDQAQPRSSSTTRSRTSTSGPSFRQPGRASAKAPAPSLHPPGLPLALDDAPARRFRKRDMNPRFVSLHDTMPG